MADSSLLTPSPAFPGRTLLESEEALDPRVKRTRQLLRQALVSLMAEKAFEEISVQDLAERATVNRVTFYDHFDDKYALFDSLIGESFRELLLARLAEGKGCCRDKVLCPLFLALCDYLAKLDSCCKQAKARSQSLFAPLVECRVKALLCDLLRARLEEEEPGRLRTSPALGATLAGWSLYGAAIEWCKAGQRPAPEDLARDVLPAVAAALYKE